MTTWLPASADGSTPLDQVFGLRPDLYERFKDFCFEVWQPPKIDPVILELCRLRMAQVHGCAAELRVRYEPARAAGLTEAKIAALADLPSAAEFSDVERACLVFAEKFALGPSCIADEDVAAMSRHLAAAEIVALCQALALFDGFIRFRLILGLDGDGGVVDPARSRALF